MHRPSSTRPSPIIALDFEASALQLNSFPIEVGVAIGNGEKVIESFEALIRPRPDWLENGVWSSRSAAIHGIEINDLATGVPADQVCMKLDTLLHGTTVHVDGGYFDAYWLMRLYNGATPKFRLTNLDAVPYKTLRQMRVDNPPKHRALADARWLHDALIEINSERADA